MNNLDKQYQNLLQDILDNGIEKSDRTGTGTLSVFGRQIRHDMKTGFPLLTTKKVYWKKVVTELLWFLHGDTNIKYLVGNGCNIWNGDAYKNYCKNWGGQNKYSVKTPILEDGVVIGSSNRKFTQEEFINRIKTDDEFAEKWGSLGKIYGKQWRDWGGRKTDGFVEYENNGYNDHIKGIDQIGNLINELKTNPDSRRLMVSAWNVGELDQMVLPPCHYGFQVYTRELSLEERRKQMEFMGVDSVTINMFFNKTLDLPKQEMYEKKIPTRAISLMWNQRSVDTFLGLPFNIASYGLLLEIIAKEVNMVPDELIGNLGDTHLYLNHIEQAKEQIGREPYPLPNILFKDHLNDFDSIIDILRINDFVLDNYQSHPTIKAPLSKIMENLTQKLTPKEIYDNYINHPSTEDTFKLFYTRKLDDDIELKAQQFESKDEDYCISLIESIMDLEDFLGWPFGDKVKK